MTEKFENTEVLEELHKEEKELRQDEKKAKAVFGLVIIFMLILAAGVSYNIYQSLNSKKSTETIVDVPSPAPVNPTATPSSELITSSPTPLPTIDTAVDSTVKDHYINIGYGTSKSTDWADVFGAVATADIGQYQNIKQVSFEAFINVPTANGTVSVRLYNKTDKHPVWNSEITRNSTSDTYQFISIPLVYDTGPKLYQVQMKTQIDVVANLVSARLHIVTQ